MLRRLALVCVTATTVLPLLAGSASASCLDDATSRSLTEGYGGTFSPSPYYPAGYVQVTGTATVVVHGDHLVSDAGKVAADMAFYAGTVAGNSADITLDFVDCVAG